MKIALTGGIGFIGTVLVERLLAAGHQVRLLSRRPSQVRLSQGVEASFFDAYEPLPEEALQGVDAVVHLAGAPIAERWSAEHKARILSSRALGTAAIAQGAVKSGVKVLVSASAVGYYGPHGDEELDERSPPGSDFLSKVSVAWEQAAAPARDAGIRVVHPRVGVVLHPGGGALGRMLPLFKAGLGGPLGRGQQYMSWIHREDLLSLLLFVLEKELEGPVNASAPAPCTNREFARTLGRVLHRPALLPTPALALKLGLGELSAVLLTGQRVLPRRALQAGFQFAYAELEGALRSLLKSSAA